MRYIRYLFMARPRGKPGKAVARPHLASNTRLEEAALHASGHGPYAAQPQYGTFLVIEPGPPLPRLAAESLVSAGLVLMRAVTVEQAVSFLHNIEVDGIIICAGTPDPEHWLRPGLEILIQLPSTQLLRIAVVAAGTLTPDELRVAFRRGAEIIPASSLRHVSGRNYLIGYLLGRFSLP